MFQWGTLVSDGVMVRSFSMNSNKTSGDKQLETASERNVKPRTKIYIDMRATG